MSGLDPLPPTIFAPLRNSTFRSIWAAVQVANVGGLVQTVAISWLMATTSASDAMVTLVMAATTLPAFILSTIAGASADTFSKRSVMIVGLSLMVAASVALSITVLFNVLDPRLILGLAFLAGCGVAIYEPAWQASVGDILERREIPPGITLVSVGYNVSRGVGPAVGGAILAFLGPLAAFSLSALCNISPLLAVWRAEWHKRTDPLPPERMVTAIQDGFRFTALSSDIRTTIMRAMLFGFVAVSMLALLPLVARDSLEGGPIVYGILFAGFGVGACVAGLGSQGLRKFITQEWLMTIASIACGICCLAVAYSSSMVITTIALALGGFGWVITWTGFGVWVQLASPRWVVGRTLSLYYACLSGGIAGGSWQWGQVAQSYSITTAFVSAALALFVVAFVGHIFPVNGGATDDDEVFDFNIPDLELDLLPQSGPISVRTTYLVSETDVQRFLASMRVRRKSITRAGARGWTLQRDLRKSTRWTEFYRTPTWMDYLRLNHRLAHADQIIVSRLAAIHLGDCPPETDLAIERTTDATRRNLQPFVRNLRP